MSTELKNVDERATEEIRFRDLFERMTRGDEQAWNTFFDVYFRHLLRVVKNKLRDVKLPPYVDAYDICQSVLWRLAEGVKGGAIELDSEKQLFSFLAVMIGNKLFKYQRGAGAARRNRRRLIDTPVEELELTSHEDDPARTAAASELYGIFRAKMSAEEIRLIEAQAAKEKWADVGAEVGQTGDAVRKHAARLVHRLEALLDRD